MTAPDRQGGSPGGDAGAGDAIVVEVVSGPIAAAVLRRVIGLLASRAGLGVDRVTEALAVADALAAHSEQVVGPGTLRVTANVEEGGLDLCVGPVPGGGATRFLELESDPELGSIIERLADGVAVGDRDGEVLEIQMRKDPANAGA